MGEYGVEFLVNISLEILMKNKTQLFFYILDSIKA